MIEEQYVSFEVAKLLKEKGFDVPCGSYFVIGENKKDKTKERFNISSVVSNRNNYKSELPDHEYISCPTQQLAMRWLREVHNIFIEVNVSIDLNGNYHYSYNILDTECKYIRKGYTYFDWTYEEAVEAALTYALENLI
jgi:hypothetical protein